MTRTGSNESTALLSALSAVGIECTNPNGLRTRLEEASQKDMALLEVATRGRKDGFRLYAKPRNPLFHRVWRWRAERVLTSAGLSLNDVRTLLVNVVTTNAMLDP